MRILQNYLNRASIMRLLGLLSYITFFFFFFIIQKRKAILKAFKEDEFQRLGGSSSPKSATPLTYNFFEQSLERQVKISTGF